MKFWMIGLLILSLFCVFPPLHGKKVAVLEEVMKPWSMVFDNGQLFVADKKNIHIYNLPDFKWVKTFGKTGEGPGEFKFNPNLTPFPGYLLINSGDKVLYFSRNGEYLRERRALVGLGHIYPAGDNYFSTKIRYDRPHMQRFKDFVLLDDSFKVIKVLATWEMSPPLSWKEERTKKFLTPFSFAQYSQDKFFVGDTSRGFYIEVYNSNGEKEYVIDRKYRKRKVTDQYKSWHLSQLKKSRSYQRSYKGMTLEYPEYFPAYRFFVTLPGRILVYFHGIDEVKREFELLDLEGRRLKKDFLKAGVIHTLYKDKIYYLIDNSETEEWELIAEDL